MSQVTLWARPTWEIDRWVKQGVFNGFSPAAEVVKDGDDAVVRLELPGVDVAKDVNVEVDRVSLSFVVSAATYTQRRRTGGRSARSVTGRSGARSSCRHTSPATQSLRRMTPAC